MRNKILSVLLIFALILPTNSTFAMEYQDSSISAKVKHYKYIHILQYSILCSCVATISAVSGYLIGYVRGNRDHLDSLENKEITFEGTLLMPEHAIPDGNFYPIPLARDYIKRVFRTEVPKLSRNSTFPATHLAAIEAYMRIIADHFEGKELGRELLSMSQVMRGLIYNLDTKITVGYLLDLLKASQNLVNQAYRSKE